MEEPVSSVRLASAADLAYSDAVPGSCGRARPGHRLVWAAQPGAGGGAWWALLSPVRVTFLLLKVSGVNLQEQHLQSRGPAYVDYVRRTSAFLPRWPKTAAAG